MTWAPIITIARAELRRGWRALLLIGLLAGIVGATTVSALALARRTTTANDRLGAKTGVDDARGSVLVHEDLVDAIVGLPEVSDSWTGRIGVAQLEGSFQFLGITAGPEAPTSMLQPVVLEGRMPRAAEDGVIEVALREDFQRVFDVALGTEVPVRFLTRDDYFRFDTGFPGGHPNGPRLTVRVVATIRSAGDPNSVPPAFTGPAALRDHPDAFEPGAAWFVRLEHGRQSFDSFSAGVEALARGRTLPPEGAEFVVADVSDTTLAEVSVDHTAELLGRALLALAGAVGLAGVVAVAQAFARHHTAGARDRDIEAALGIVASQRRTARALAAMVPATEAMAMTAVAAVLAASLEPIGAIEHYEPAPGRAVNLAIVGPGVAGIGVLVLLLGLASTSLSRRRALSRPLRESRIVDRMARLGGSPAGITGLRFALEPGRGARAVPVRSAITGAVIGIGGVVAGIVFTSSLDRLVTSPDRSGVPYDAFVSDVSSEDVGSLLAEPGVDTVVMVASAPLVVDGRSISGHALTDARGSLHVDLDQGRLPRTPDEITLGLRVARDLGKAVGDTVTAVDGAGDEHVLAVVGTGVVPTFDGEQLGVNALVTTDGLARAALSNAFTGAAVTARPGIDPAQVIDRLDDDFEADAQSLPTEVDNLRQLGRLPSLVAGLVGTIALLALANALVVLVRRRRRDLAVLRTIGCTRRQQAVAVLVMALSIVAIGVVVGVPVGIAVGASIWRLTAAGAFVTADALVPASTITVAASCALAVAVIAALLPARRAGQTVPAELLRAE